MTSSACLDTITLMTRSFRIAYSADFFDETGAPQFRDYGRDMLDRDEAIEVSRFSRHLAEITPEQLEGFQAIIALTPRVTAQTLSQSHNLLAINRFGAGYDTVDVPACTAADVVLLTTPGCVNRPVAEATVGWMIALSHHMLVKDRLVREARWSDRTQYMGTELRDRTLGVIGLGGIGTELVKLLSGLGMRPPVVFDPYVDEQAVTARGGRKVDLENLLAESDFVSLHCPLNEETRNLIGARELSLMKSSAFLINTARGGIANEDALYDALTARRIAGAAIDCFENEPITAPHRFAGLDNVILAPHSIAWTRELFRDIGQTASRNLLHIARGRTPEGVINPEVFDRPTFVQKWERVRLQPSESASESTGGAS